MSRTYAFALGALAFVLVVATMTACEQGRLSLTSAPASTAATHAPSAALASIPETQAASLKARGDEFRDRGQSHEALEAYQAALRQDPNDLGVRHALAQLLAQLHRSAEAITAYTWVFQNSLPGSDIARAAEQWLREADSHTVVNDAGGAGTQGRLSGHLTWTALDSNRQVPSVSLILEGNDAETKGETYLTRAVMNSDYEFTSVRPGGYRLVAKSQMIKVWETAVVVTNGGATVVNLEQSQAVAPADSLLPKSGG
jgi:tetratricopeptide (TPR) repeat protein